MFEFEEFIEAALGPLIKEIEEKNKLIEEKDSQIKNLLKEKDQQIKELTEANKKQAEYLAELKIKRKALEERKQFLLDRLKQYE